VGRMSIEKMIRYIKDHDSFKLYLLRSALESHLEEYPSWDFTIYYDELDIETTNEHMRRIFNISERWDRRWSKFIEADLHQNIESATRVAADNIMRNLLLSSSRDDTALSAAFSNMQVDLSVIRCSLPYISLIMERIIIHSSEFMLNDIGNIDKTIPARPLQLIYRVIKLVDDNLSKDMLIREIDKEMFVCRFNREVFWNSLLKQAKAKLELSRNRTRINKYMKEAERRSELNHKIAEALYSL